MFHHDIAEPHTYLQSRQKLLQLLWDVLPHPPYPSDISEEIIKRYLELYSVSKGRIFYERRILRLPERWQQIVDQHS